MMLESEPAREAFLTVNYLLSVGEKDMSTIEQRRVFNRVRRVAVEAGQSSLYAVLLVVS